MSPSMSSVGSEVAKRAGMIPRAQSMKATTFSSAPSARHGADPGCSVRRPRFLTDGRLL